jgi:hypothetical protein
MEVFIATPKKFFLLKITFMFHLWRICIHCDCLHEVLQGIFFPEKILNVYFYADFKIVVFLNGQKDRAKKLETDVRVLDEGSERDQTWGRGGQPTLPGLFHSTFQPSQRGFFSVHPSV